MPKTQTVTFNYTGAVQQWIVPNGVEQVTIDCYGAQGGDGIYDNKTTTTVPGGYGGRARATFPVTPGETLYIYVGGRGRHSTMSSSSLAGWNGGGEASLDEEDGKNYYKGSGGGGASDVRRGGQTYSHRIIVAGGGGGSGIYYERISPPLDSLDYLRGGAGGGLIGGNAGRLISRDIEGGYGGTQTAGGKRGNDRTYGPLDGGFGYGGRAGRAYSAGGGGGGWYGGGGGDIYGGGGGGSGYIAPEGINPYFETGVRSGHGLVIIQYEIIPPLYVRVNGQLRESDSIHVRVNGQLREVDGIWTRVNGQLREV